MNNDIYRRPRRMGVRIQVDETGEIFNSIRDCAEALGIDVGWAGKVSRRDCGLCSCLGLHLTRIDDPDFVVDPDRRGRPGLRIRIVETGEEFESITDCANHIRGSAGAISEVLYNRRGRLTHKGFHFELIHR